MTSSVSHLLMDALTLRLALSSPSSARSDGSRLAIRADGRALDEARDEFWRLSASGCGTAELLTMRRRASITALR